MSMKYICSAVQSRRTPIDITTCRGQGDRMCGISLSLHMYELRSFFVATATGMDNEISDDIFIFINHEMIQIVIMCGD